MGRPSKLTPEVQKRIVNAIKAGNYYEAACALGGISYKVFREWMLKGEEHETGKYREFRDAVEQAQAQAEVTIVAQWKAAIPYSWQAARDFLARRFPERWKPQEGHEIQGELAQNVMVYLPDNGRDKPAPAAEPKKKRKSSSKSKTSAKKKSTAAKRKPKTSK